MARPRNSSSPLFTLAAIVIAIAALHVAKEILLPLALAVLISFLLTPLANQLERWRLGRIPSVIAVVSVTFAILGVLGWIVTWQMVELGVMLPTYRENLVAKVREVKPRSNTIKGITETLEEVQDTIAEEEAPAKDSDGAAGRAVEGPRARKEKAAERNRLTRQGDDLGVGDQAWRLFGWDTGFGRGDDAEPEVDRPIPVQLVGTPMSPLQQVLSWAGPLMQPLATAGITVVLVIFILIRREDQRNRLLQLFGSTHLHATTEALTDVTDRVSRYLRMQFLINAGYGVSVAAGLWFIGVPSALMWGVLSFALRFLPYIGPWLSAVMPLFVSLATSQGWSQPAMVIVWFAVLELIVNNVAEPLLYGRSTGVSGVGVIVAAVFWTWVWGAIGLVLAMPLTVCMVVMARYIPGLHFLVVLLGDQPAMSDEQRVYQRLLAGDEVEARALAAARLNQASLAEVYDHIIIPAVVLAERDRHAGHLNEEQEELVEATSRDLVEELGHYEAELPRDQAADAETSWPSAAKRRLKVLCIPLRDEADEISAVMLKQLLVRESMDVELAAAQALTGEVVELVERERYDLVVICILPPLPPRNSRLLCRRLREKFPTLPLIVGYWCGDCRPEITRRLCADDGEAVTTLAQAVDRVRAIAARPPLAAGQAG